MSPTATSQRRESYSATSPATGRPPEVQPVALQRERLRYGDSIRVIASIAVVGVHVSMQVSESSSLLGTAIWSYYAFVDGMVRWAVPGFLMLSGAILLSPDAADPPNAFYYKRFRRIGPVLLFWPLFYLGWSRWYQHETLPLYNLIGRLANGSPFHHLHFLFALPGLYFLTPPLRVYVAHAPKRQIATTAVFIVLVTAASDVIQSIRGFEYGMNWNATSRFVPFLGYFLLGYVLRDVKLSAFQTWCCLAGFLLSAALYALDAALLLRFAPPNSPGRWYFTSQTNVTRFTSGICMFLLLSNWFRAGVSWRPLDRTVVKVLAPASLGVYLVHPVFIDLCREVGVSIDWPNLWVGLPLTWLAVWTLSLLFTLGLSSVPYLRRIIGS